MADDSAAPPPMPSWFSNDGLAQPMSLALAGMFGGRWAAAPPADTLPSELTLLGQLDADEAYLSLGVAAAGLDSLVERALGGALPPAGSTGHPVADSSAARAAIAWSMVQALERALRAADVPVGQTRTGHGRDPFPTEGPYLPLSLGGMLFLLAGRAADRPSPPRSAQADGRTVAWHSRATALSQQVALPVSLRLADHSLPLSAVMALGVGDVLPLPTLHQVKLVVSGRDQALIPLHALGNGRRDDAGAEGLLP